MSLWPLHIHLVLFMMLPLAVIGCATIRVDVIPGSITEIKAGDCMTVVLDFEGGSPERAEKLEKNLGGCISNAMAERKSSVKFIDPGEFRRAVFFDRNITSAPWDRQLILGLLSAPYFHDKIKFYDLRYLITVREGTMSYTEFISKAESFWSFSGYWVHRKKTELVADIIDLQRGSDSGEVRVTVADRGYYTYAYIIPIILPAFTEDRACQTLGRVVTKFLLGEITVELSK